MDEMALLPLLDDSDLEELAVRFRAQVGIVPPRLWDAMSLEACDRVGRMGPKAAQKLLDSNARRSAETIALEDLLQELEKSP